MTGECAPWAAAVGKTAVAAATATAETVEMGAEEAAGTVIAPLPLTETAAAGMQDAAMAPAPIPTRTTSTRTTTTTTAAAVSTAAQGPPPGPVAAEWCRSHPLLLPALSLSWPSSSTLPSR